MRQVVAGLFWEQDFVAGSSPVGPRLRDRRRPPFGSAHHTYVGKYFLDFVVGDVDIEIDGKQHQYVERKLSDIERDDYLRKQGYFVYRIRWNEINTISGKQMMKDKIDLLLDFLDTFT